MVFYKRLISRYNRRHIPLAMKLNGSFLLICLFLTIVGGSGMAGIGQLNNHTDSIIQQALPKLQAVTLAQSAVSRTSRDQDQMLVDINSGAAGEDFDRLQTDHQSFQAAIQRYLHYTHDQTEKSVIDQLDNILPNYYKAFDAVLADILKDTPESIADMELILRTNGDTLPARVTDLLGQLVVISQNQMLQARQAEKATYHVLLWIMGVVAVIAIIAAIGLARILALIIIKPVSQIAQAAESLASGTFTELASGLQALALGDLDRAHAIIRIVPIDVQSHDELGLMVTSFNIMQDRAWQTVVALEEAREGLRLSRDALQVSNYKLAELNATLEQRVVERTTELEKTHTELAQTHNDLLNAYQSLQDAHDALAALATTDPLTGLPNHRAMITVLDGEIERARRYNRLFGVLFCDIDHFKSLNDSSGHAAGDIALQVFGQIIRDLLRTSDTIGRWGGEEFLIVLPETSCDSAMQAAERIRSAIASQVFPIGIGIHLTCSIGVACVGRDGNDRESLVNSADHAMYTAKQLGRNQVRAASEEVVLIMKPEVHSRETTLMLGVVEALAALVEARNQYSGDHIQAVSDLMVAIAMEMGCDPDFTQLIRIAGRLYDIGKVAIPDAILQKTGQLTTQEWEIMQMHSVVGANVIGHVPTLQALVPMIRSHHERWDGQGYPDKLAGEDIPLGGRIAAVADAFQAMIRDRPYRKALSLKEARDIIETGSGILFDPDVVAALIRVMTAEQISLSQDSLFVLNEKRAS